MGHQHTCALRDETIEPTVNERRAFEDSLDRELQGPPPKVLAERWF